jgi:hypothetical protein
MSGKTIAACSALGLVWLASVPRLSIAVTYDTGTLVQKPPPAARMVGNAAAAMGTSVALGAPFDDTVAVDAGAVYLVDGVSGAVQRAFFNPVTPPGDPSGDRFGWSVAVAGANLLVGAPSSSTAPGAAYLIDGATGETLLTLQSPSPQANDQFGFSVAVVGTALLVGAPKFDQAGQPDAGAAYLFDGNPASPTFGQLQKILQKSSPIATDQMGYSVAALGPYALVGAPFDDTGAVDAGAVFLFDPADPSPTPAGQKIADPSPQTNDNFGWSIATTGFDVIVGVPNEDALGQPDSGGAYRIDGNPTSPTFGQVKQRLLFSEPVSFDHLGKSVATSGSDALVGSPDAYGGIQGSGVVYFFPASGGANPIWIRLQNPSQDVGDQFGAAIAASASRIFVTAPGDDTATTDAGAAYVYASNRTLQNSLLLPQLTASDTFGASLGGVPELNVVLVGVPADHQVGQPNAGTAYQVGGDPANPGFARIIGSLRSPTPAGGDDVGAAVAGVGGNMLVGADHDGTGANGAAHLYSGTTGQLLHTFDAPADASAFGRAVAGVGAKAVIGASFTDAGGVKASGRAFLYDADPASPTFGQQLLVFANPTPASNDDFAVSVAAVGSNVLVGAPNDDTAAGNAGAAYLFDGTVGGAPLKTFLSPTPASNDHFGASVAGVGTKVIVGAPDADTGATNAGAVYVFDGDPASPTFGQLERTIQKLPQVGNGHFGVSLAAVTPWLLVGAPFEQSSQGRAYLVDPTSGAFLRTFQKPGGPAANDEFGHAVAAIGFHVAVSAWKDDTGANNAGAVAIFKATLACGDGIVDPGEGCDGGPCCTTSCHPMGVGAACAPDACTVGATCNAQGVCAGGSPRNCNDNNACTTDACAPNFGCVHGNVPDGSVCGDGNPCTNPDACQSGHCTGPPSGICDDQNPCTVDVCDPVTGCSHSPVTDGISCSDGNICNGSEVCHSGVCIPGTPLNCDDGNPCTQDPCSPTQGCQPHVPLTGTACPDSNPCTDDVCQSGTCVHTPVTCADDGNSCTDETCDPVLGCQHTPKPDNTTCDDGNACTGTTSQPDRCMGGVCIAGPCDVGKACGALCGSTLHCTAPPDGGCTCQ